MRTLEIMDRGCAAYMLSIGIQLIDIVPGDWHRYRLDDTDGAATSALDAWRDGSAIVNARAYWGAFKTLKRVQFGPTAS